MSDYFDGPRSPSPDDEDDGPQSPAEEYSAPASPNAPVSPEPDGPASPTNDDLASASPADEPTIEPPADFPASPNPEGPISPPSSPAPAKQDSPNSDDEVSPMKGLAAPVSQNETVSSDDYISPKKMAPTSPKDDADSDSEPEAPKSKKAKIDDSDDSDDEKPVGNDDKDDEKKAAEDTHKKIFGSDDEEETSEPKKKKVLIGEDSDDEFKEKPEGDKLVQDVFGSDDDNDEEEEEGAPVEHGGPHEEDERNFEWDFDRMMAEKKAEKRRRRKKGDGIDIINDDDGLIQKLVQKMRHAAKEDRNANVNRQPAFHKRKMLPIVKDILLKIDMMEAIIDGGMMSAVSEWLAPLPDKSLPCFEIRSTLLHLLKSYKLEQGTLRQSGLGRAVMMLYRHPRETGENKRIAQQLIADWARPIFNIDNDFASLTREERSQRDYNQMSDHLKRRRESQEEASTSKADDEKVINRARVPRPSNTAYVMRPQSSIDGQFKGESKRVMSRLDRTQRDFKERTKKTKVARAVGVSIEGRHMAI